MGDDFDFLTTGGQKTHQIRNHLSSDGIVNVPLLPPALEQTRPPENIQMVGQGWSGHAQGFLNLTYRHLSFGANDKEKYPQASQVCQRFERLHMHVGCL
jgi:hypothetical protein